MGSLVFKVVRSKSLCVIRPLVKTTLLLLSELFVDVFPSIEIALYFGLECMRELFEFG
jgi:hypothetical protein